MKVKTITLNEIKEHPTMSLSPSDYIKRKPTKTGTWLVQGWGDSPYSHLAELKMERRRYSEQTLGWLLDSMKAMTDLTQIIIWQRFNPNEQRQNADGTQVIIETEWRQIAVWLREQLGGEWKQHLS